MGFAAAPASPRARLAPCPLVLYRWPGSGHPLLQAAGAGLHIGVRPDFFSARVAELSALGGQAWRRTLALGGATWGSAMHQSQQNNVTPRPTSSRASAAPSRRKQELIVFVLLTLVLAPVLAVATVGGYGLGVWVYQMLTGPPGPPPKAPRPPGVVPQ
jgi:nitrate reductase NapE